MPSRRVSEGSLLWRKGAEGVCVSGIQGSRTSFEAAPRERATPGGARHARLFPRERKP